MAEEIKELAAPKEADPYVPMADPFTPEPERKNEYNSEKDGLEAAAAEVTESRQASEPPAAPGADEEGIVERRYQYLAGEHAGEFIPANQTLTAEREARDVELMRQYEVAQAQDLAPAVDALRANYSPEQQPDQQTQQQAADAQPPAQSEQQAQTVEAQPADGVHPDVRAALQNEHVRNALAAEVAQVEQARQAYATAARQAAAVSGASLLASFPELANVPAAHLQSAIAAIGVKDPHRAEAMRAHLSQTASLYQASRQAEAAQQQIQAQQQAQQMQQVQAWAKAEDARFERDVIAKEDPATFKRVTEQGMKILAEDYGVDPKAFAHTLQTTPAMRSKEAMQIIYDAMKYRILQRDAATKLDRSAPPAQRPGVSQPSDNSGLTHALARFKSDPSVVNASKVMLAKRAAAKR